MIETLHDSFCRRRRRRRRKGHIWFILSHDFNYDGKFYCVDELWFYFLFSAVTMYLTCVYNVQIEYKNNDIKRQMLTLIMIKKRHFNADPIKTLNAHDTMPLICRWLTKQQQFFLIKIKILLHLFRKHFLYCKNLIGPCISSICFFKDCSSSTPCMEFRMVTHMQGSTVSNPKFKCIRVHFSVNKVICY